MGGGVRHSRLPLDPPMHYTTDSLSQIETQSNRCVNIALFPKTSSKSMHDDSEYKGLVVTLHLLLYLI